MTGLLELADRCEKATGPDRELDVLVERECGPLAHKVRELEAGSPLNTIAVIAECADGPYFKVPAYTASLDAAMTLVPEGHKFQVCQNDSDQTNRQWLAELRRGHMTSYDKAFPSWAATPALALCAAALRARAQP